MDKSELLEKYEESRSFLSPLYEDCEDDWEFLHGIGQWEPKGQKQREQDGRPCLTLNQLLPYAQQVVNDIRQAKMAIRVSPVDDKADIDTAEIFQGIIRNIERQSSFNTVVSTAALNAVGAGIGWMKIRTDYADVDTFDQEIYIDRVLDFSSVYTWGGNEALDGSDNEGAIVLDTYTKDRFEELWPDAEAASFDGESKDDEIAVAECYYKYYKSGKLYRIKLVGGIQETIDEKQMKLLEDNGTVDFEIILERDVEYPYVKKCLYAGGEDPLEEEDFPSKYIPLVPVIGEEVFINNQREFHSLIRQAKDAQRMYNYHKSASVEILALAPKAPYIAPAGSFKSAPNKWKNLNSKNYAFAEYDIVYDKNGMPMPPPQRQSPPTGSPASMQEALGAREDIRLAIGMPQSNMGEAAGEISGIAIRNRQIEGDNATFHFVDNLAASISQVGRILVDMIPRLYSERKIARIIGENGEEKNVQINQPIQQIEGEKMPAKGIYDLGAGKYDVVCDVGASYSSKRQETADKMSQLISAKPELMDVIGDLVVEATDLPMAKEIADRLRSVMDPALLGEDPQAAKLQAATQALKVMEDKLITYQAALDDKKKNQEFEENVKLKELQQEQQRLINDTAKTQAEIEKMRAETHGFNVEAVQALGGAVQGIAAQVEDIGLAMNTILDAKEAEMVEATSEPFNTEEPQD